MRDLKKKQFSKVKTNRTDKKCYKNQPKNNWFLHKMHKQGLEPHLLVSNDTVFFPFSSYSNLNSVDSDCEDDIYLTPLSYTVREDPAPCNGKPLWEEFRLKTTVGLGNSGEFRWICEKIYIFWWFTWSKMMGEVRWGQVQSCLEVLISLQTSGLESNSNCKCIQFL